MQVIGRYYLRLALSLRSFDPNSRSNLSRAWFCREFPYVVRRGTPCNGRLLGGNYESLKGVAGLKAGYVELGNHNCGCDYCDLSLCSRLGMLRWREEEKGSGNAQEHY